MTIATSDQKIIQASRSDATGYVDRANAAARRLDAAFVKNVPEMTEATFKGYADGLHSKIAALEERMVMGSSIEIEAAIRSVLTAIDAVEAFLSSAKSKVTDSMRVTDDA